MRYVVTILCLMLTIAVSLACREKLKSCKKSIECCSRYCRDGKCTNFGDAPDDKGFKNPCRPNLCGCGEICLLQQVQCFTFPCPPVRECYEI